MSAVRCLVGFCVLASLLAAAPGVAQRAPLLYELASPNERLNGFFGAAATAVPDLDADGAADLLIGAPGEGPGVPPFSDGRAYVFSGATGTLLYELAPPGEGERGLFGSAVGRVPDVDGDGVNDLLVGAREESPGASPDRAGRAYLFSGATGALLRTFSSPNEERRGDFGSTVAGVPDVNGDGRADLLIGARFEDPGTSPHNTGWAYVFSGATGALLYELSSPNPRKDGNFGAELASGPDLDGDGVRDLLVGAYREDPDGSPFHAGRAYVFSGATGAVLRTFVSPHEEDNGRFGRSFMRVPDLDGDGFDDLIIGARWEDPGLSPTNAGRAYVYSGATSTLLYELTSPDEQQSGLFGHFCSGLADADGDGFGDLFIGAVQEGPGASPFAAGRAHLFSGATGALLHTFVSPNEEGGGQFGTVVTGIGDVNGDRRADFVVAANRESPGSSPARAGRVYVFSGRSVPLNAAESAGSANEERAAVAHPNPTTGRTTLTVTLPAPSAVRVALYDVLGREVAAVDAGRLEAGPHRLALDGTALPTGVYVWRFVADGQAQTGRLTLVE